MKNGIFLILVFLVSNSFAQTFSEYQIGANGPINDICLHGDTIAFCGDMTSPVNHAGILIKSTGQIFQLATNDLPANATSIRWYRGYYYIGLAGGDSVSNFVRSKYGQDWELPQGIQTVNDDVEHLFYDSVSDKIFLSGKFSSINGNTCGPIAAYDGSTVDILNGGPNQGGRGWVMTMAGNTFWLVTFNSIFSYYSLSSWDGTNWNTPTLHGDVTSINLIEDIKVFDDSNLVVSGGYYNPNDFPYFWVGAYTINIGDDSTRVLYKSEPNAGLLERVGNSLWILGRVYTLNSSTSALGLCRYDYTTDSTEVVEHTGCLVGTRTAATGIDGKIYFAGDNSLTCDGTLGGNIIVLDTADSATGIQNIVRSESITVFPNPTTDFVKISFPETTAPSELVVYSSLGEHMAVHGSHIGNQIALDVSTYPSGMYVVKTTKYQAQFVVVR